jgi:parallel beta-helix repeat protein/putative cofactor-binding repeat protein
MATFAQLLNWVSTLTNHHSRLQRARSRWTFRPRIDALEPRCLLATFTVDDDFASDNVALRRYDTIQEAVDAARPGDVIQVRPGSYEEEVVVNKRLTLTGAFATLLQAENPARASIVDPPDDLAAGDPATGFNVQANDVVIQGFTIAELDGLADPDGSVGITTNSTVSGFKLLKNVIENNTIGIYLNSSTANNAKPSVVSGNVIRNNNAPGAAAGNGIYSDQGLSKTTISGNVISGHDNTAIILVPLDPATLQPVVFNTKLTIAGNIISDSEVLLTATTASSLSGNKIINSNTNGIELAGSNANLSIVGNIITNPNWTGINFTSGLTGEAEINHRVWSNVITSAGGDGGSGIRLRAGASGNWLKANTVTGSEDPLLDPAFGNGISLEDAHDNRIEANTLQNNARDGVVVDALSTGNLILSNTARNNGEHDYHDDSIGTGTAGTANTYRNNRGRTQNRPGLIRFFI